jgi:hypothetical protein
LGPSAGSFLGDWQYIGRDDADESDDDFWRRAKRTTRLFVGAVALGGVLTFTALLAHLTSGSVDENMIGSLIVSGQMQLVLIIEMQSLWHQLDSKDFSVYRLPCSE